MLRAVSVLVFVGALLATTPVMAQEAPAPGVPAAGAPAGGVPAGGIPATGVPAGPAAGPGGNQFCAKDMAPLLQKRAEIGQKLTAINKRPKPKTFPAFKRNFNDFCSGMSEYIAADRSLYNYMVKNKDFCTLRDEDLAGINKDLSVSQATRTKICSHPPKEPTAPPPGQGGPAMPRPPVDLRLQ